MDLGGKIQNCTCQEDEIHVELKKNQKQNPLDDIYVFIKNTLRKTKPNYQQPVEFTQMLFLVNVLEESLGIVKMLLN